MTTDLYETLDVPRDADPASIRRAYRKAAKRTHPDAPGGSVEAFSKVSRALKVLADPDARGRYDRTGDAEPGQDTRAQRILQTALQHVLAGIDQAASRTGSISDFDVMGAARAAAAEAIREHKAKVAMAKRNHALVEKAVGRMKAGPDADGLLIRMLRQRVADMAEVVTSGNAETEVLEAIAAVLKTYEYDFDRPQYQPLDGFTHLSHMSL